MNLCPVSSVNAKKFMGLFEGVPASIAFVFIRRMRAIVLASMGFVSPNPLVEASPKPLCRTAGEGTILTRRIE